ncbi:IS3 family transposase [Caulifigura coniformis]|uniref:IS3 family transposase n=1 Tax=Caulifigura coniformis TaxID=2527983 RepID=UPI0011A66442
MAGQLHRLHRRSPPPKHFGDVGVPPGELELVDYGSDFEARRELSSYVRYYNAERRHSAQGYVSPVEFERQQAVRK